MSTKFGKHSSLKDARRALTLAGKTKGLSSAGSLLGSYLALDCSNDPLTGDLAVTADMVLGAHTTTLAQRLTLIEAAATDCGINFISGTAGISSVAASLSFSTGLTNYFDFTATWFNPSDAEILDGVFANPTGQIGGVAGYTYGVSDLLCTAASPGIPAGATIVGVKVDVWKKQEYTGGAVSDYAVHLFNDTTVIGTNRAKAGNWPTALTQYTYGGMADTWEAALTPTLINSGNFRVGIVATIPAGDPQTWVYVDCVTMTIYYTVSSQWTIGSSAAGNLEFSQYLGFTDPYRMKLATTGQLTIGAPVGTAPLGIASTTVCTNLNSDLLDGYHAASFMLAQPAVTTTAANLTLTSAHHFVIVTSAVTITLPATSGITGRHYYIKSTVDGVTVDGNASETIDGELTQTLNAYEGIHIFTDGSNWFVV